MQTTTEKTDYNEALAKRGWTIESTNAMAHVQGDWPCLQYMVEIHFNGRQIWSGPFRLGIGHAQIPKKGNPPGFPLEYCGALAAIQRGASLQDRKLTAMIATIFANRNKVKPSLADVVNSLCRDADGADQSFEAWAGDLGYNPDSIKAKGIWEECLKIRTSLNRVPSDELSEVRELLQDY